MACLSKSPTAVLVVATSNWSRHTVVHLRAGPKNALPRRWVSELVHWYNQKHCHSGIGFVTPEQRLTQIDIDLLQERDKVYAAARSANPNRWPSTTRDWSHFSAVHLNPETSDKQSLSPQKTT